MSVAIVAMVNHTALVKDDDIFTDECKVTSEPKEVSIPLCISYSFISGFFPTQLSQVLIKFYFLLKMLHKFSDELV